MTTATPRLIGLFTAVEAGQPMIARARVQALAEAGLVGDRYASGRGTFSSRMAIAPGGRALSVLDCREIARCNRRLAMPLAPAFFRRNLVIAGLDLQVLRGARLQIGEVIIRLVGRCAPCGYLSRLTGQDMQYGLYRGGGMRAAIEQGGELWVGQTVTRIETSPGRRLP